MTVPIATPILLDVERYDHRYLQRVIKTAPRKGLDPRKIIKSLYIHTYSCINDILVHELCCEDMKSTAKACIEMGLAEADISKLEEAESIHQLLEVLSLRTQWDDTDLLRKLIVRLPPEKWEQADEVLKRYECYMDVYFCHDMVADHPIEDKVASETEVTLEITSRQDFDKFSEKDCNEIFVLLLKTAYQIPKRAVVLSGARAANSTTVLFFVHKEFVQSIMLKTCTDPLTLWVFLELRITRVKIPGLFDVNVVQLLNLQLVASLRSGLNGKVDFIGVTRVFPYQVVCLTDVDIITPEKQRYMEEMKPRVRTTVNLQHHPTSTKKVANVEVVREQTGVNLLPPLLHSSSKQEPGNKSELVMEGPVSKALQDKMLLSSGIEESNVMLGLPQPSELKTAGLQVEASGLQSQAVLPQLASAAAMIELTSQPPEEFGSAELELILQSMQQWNVHELGLLEYPYIEGYEEEKEPEVLIPPAKEKGDAEQIRADDLDLICEACLDQLSHKQFWKPCGTCKSVQHIKKMVVKNAAGVHIPVRCCMEGKMIYGRRPVCEDYPNCYKGDNCPNPHGKEESLYWSGNMTPVSELCLDCRFIAAEGIVKECHSSKHKASRVVYRHMNTREVVSIVWPRTVPRGDFRIKHPLHSCHDPKHCSFQHHILQTKILTLWKNNTVPTPKEPSPEKFLEVLKRAVQPTCHLYSKDNGPPPKSELTLKNQFLTEEPLTPVTYKERFHILLHWEEHAHMEAMRKADGMYRFVFVGCHEEGKMIADRHSKKNVCLGVLAMSDLNADHLRQAASGVYLCFAGGTMFYAYIQQQPRYHESQPCLAVNIKRKPIQLPALPNAGVAEDLSHYSLQEVEATFVLKHSYFTSLHSSLNLTPEHVLKRLVPNVTALKATDVSIHDDNVDLQKYRLDDAYQKPACAKLLKSSPNAPFLICGPFGAGKTHLLAIAALILSKDPDSFILIATHHMKTADQYIIKYMPHLKDVDQDELKIARVVSRKGYIPPYPSKYVKTINELKSDRIDYSIIVTTFGVMLHLQNVLQMRECKYFTHIFVDEGAQAREPETLGAFCYAGPDTKIVIAGDHKQVGPQTTVLGNEARDNGLTVSLVERLHQLYQMKDLQDDSRNYQAILLANHRSHPSVFCLPNRLFYGGYVNAHSANQVHPKFPNSVHFVCTSLEELPECIWDNDQVYMEQVMQELLVALQWVADCARNWPEVEWGAKNLGSLCVVVPNRLVERLWRQLARGAWKDVTCKVAYDIQGREFKAVFICTSEAVDEHCATRDPVKSLCDQYVFNTVITRACSLVVAIGNPFRLMHIEGKLADSANESKNCWQAFFYYCLQCNSLVLSKQLNSKLEETATMALQQSTRLMKIETILFDRATEALKEMHQCQILAIQDSILKAYRHTHIVSDCHKGLIRTRKRKDDLSWSIWDDVEPKGSSAVSHDLVTCRLWQVSYQTCTAVPVDPSGGGPVMIIGMKKRRCAFNGALVGIKILDEKQRTGEVRSLLEQVSVQPQICVVDKVNAKLFVPVDNKSPRLKNSSHIARHVLSEKTGIFDQRTIENKKHEQQYVVCFDPSHLKSEIPQISQLIPKEVAQHLLFVVCPTKWDANRSHPLGAVVAVLPKGITELYANKVLAIQHFVPDPDSDVELTFVQHPTTQNASASITTDTAIGIVSKEGYSSIAVTVQEQNENYVVGLHVCNAADVVVHSKEFIENTFTRWAGMFGECQGKTVYCPTLPKKEIQALCFNCDAACSAITFNVCVSAASLIAHVESKEILRRIVDLRVDPSGFVETTVKCGLMLDWSELESLFLHLFDGSIHRLRNKGLATKVENSPLPVWNMLTVLHVVADKLSRLRQGHRGYPELQQSQESFRYPEAWKMVYELVICASRQAAEKIGESFCSTIPLNVQPSPSQSVIPSMKRIAENYITSPFFQWLKEYCHEKPRNQMEIVPFTRPLYEELAQSVNLSVSTLKQLLMQPHRHPHLGVVESLIRGALPNEEFAVKRITLKKKKARKYPPSALIEKAGGKHHSVQAVIAPYSCPFNSIFDIYVQDLLLRAVRQEENATRDEPRQEETLHAVARFCNMAVATARSYELCMTSLNVAVHAQQSSICVEAFVKEMDGGNIHLCYPDPTLSSIKSLQAIRTRLVTKSDKAKVVMYSTKVTCVTEQCRILKDLKYTTQHTSLKDEVHTPRPEMMVYYEKGCHLARCTVVPEYSSTHVAISCAAWKLAMAHINNPQMGRQTADQLIEYFLGDHEKLESDGEKMKEPPAKQDVSDSEIRLAPFGIFHLPFKFSSCQVVKMWLHTDMNEYVLTPKPQLIELNPDVRICLQHNLDIESCFTGTSHVEPSKPRYSFCDNYFKVWEEIVLAEAAVHSVRDTEQFLFTDFQLNFSGFTIPSHCTNEEFYEPVGEIWSILPQKFLASRQDLFPIEQGYFACIRFDEKWDRHEGHLYPSATDSHVRTVMHMVVDHVLKMEDQDKKEVRMTLEEEVIKSDLKVCFKVVGRHNARISPLMKNVLEKLKPPCEMQLFQMFLPIKKVYHALRLLAHKCDDQSLGYRVALGKLETLVQNTARSVDIDEIKEMLLLEPYTLWHWDDSCQRLNCDQIAALLHAMVNEFQLIQGPPGTGKSITGAHIAYAFALWNRKKAADELAATGGSDVIVKDDTERDDHQAEDTTTDGDASGLPPLQCVLYCGPSNVSVDVVLNHLHGMAVRHDNPKGLRILRLYGKMIETRYHVGPYYDKHLYTQKDEFPIKMELQQYALHTLVRTKSRQQERIKEMESKFDDMQMNGLIATASERFAYREVIRKAEEEIIKKGNFDIVLCTCNEASGYRFRRNISPIQCIIDEAGMTTEPEAIVALSQAKQAVLIGDHVQLQPTVMSKVAEEKGLKVSLFERYANLFKEKYPKGCTNFVQLTHQYRMLKQICEFPSRKFYDGKLKTMTQGSPFLMDEFWPSSSGPVAFCDVVGYEEEAESEEDIKTSKKNLTEAKKAIEVVKALDVMTQSRAEIVVITPYKAQQRLITTLIGEANKKWKVKTVDASQGSEADFVVLSTVRCKPLDELKDETDKHWMMENLGHVTDSHRLCVALTRARYGLVIIGNQALLSKDPLWKELVDHCKDRKYMVYRNECKKFPPQGRINQVSAVRQRKEGRLRMPMPKAHTHMLKPVGIRVTDREHKKEVDEAVKYYEELMKIVKFLMQESNQLSGLTVTIE